MSAEEAVRTYIHDGATVAFGGFVGAMVPEEVNKTIQELYLSSQGAHRYLRRRPGRLG